MGAYLSQPVTEKETFTGQGVDVKYGGAAMQGWRKTMEDAHIAIAALDGNPDVCLFSVFDGHGGGEVAKFCQRHMPTALAQQLQDVKEGGIEELLVNVFHRMDELLRDGKYSDEIEQLKGKQGSDEDDDSDSPMDPLDLIKRVFKIKNYGAEPPLNPLANPIIEITEDPPEVKIQAGCTSVVALKRGAELYVANAGDSRGVLSRRGQALALSDDHKPAQEGERRRIIAAGGFLSEIGGVCRVNGNLNLSRAIGDLKYKTNRELPASEQIITAEPDVCKVVLQPEDRFLLLACDGIWDVMTNQQAVDFINQRLDQGLSIPQVCSSLLDACLAADPKEAKGVGCDNMTVVLVLLNQGAPAAAAAPEPAAAAAPAATS